MLKSRIVYGFIGLFAITASAQTPREQAEPAKTLATEAVRDADVEQRRSSLRATLKSQLDIAMKNDARYPSERHLSVQERSDLRQQLRQQ